MLKYFTKLSFLFNYLFNFLFNLKVKSYLTKLRMKLFYFSSFLFMKLLQNRDHNKGRTENDARPWAVQIKKKLHNPQKINKTCFLWEKLLSKVPQLVCWKLHTNLCSYQLTKEAFVCKKVYIVQRNNEFFKYLINVAHVDWIHFLLHNFQN